MFCYLSSIVESTTPINCDILSVPYSLFSVQMKFVFIIDSLPQLDTGHDSTVAIMEAAQIAGHEVWVTQVHQLSVIEGKAWAILSQVQLTPVKLQDKKWVAIPNWYQISETILRCLEDMDAVFMRKDPPVTIRYLYATSILELINPERTLVINSPQGLREANEKYTLCNLIQ